MQFFHPEARKRSFFSQTRFYGVTEKGIKIYDHVYKSPTIRCYPGAYDYETDEKTDFQDHTFTYLVNFKSSRCNNTKNSKTYEEKFFRSCEITSDFIV